MKNFKKIVLTLTAIFALVNCIGCSVNPDKNTEDNIAETTTSTSGLHEIVSVCTHTNGGDATSQIIDDKYHQNGVTCFDCGETVWINANEEHDFSNVTGKCACGYACEHGYGDDFYYEIAEDSHTVKFVCNVCNSIIYEEESEHFIRDGECAICGFESQN